jgi:hypothetical protein
MGAKKLKIPEVMFTKYLVVMELNINKSCPNVDQIAY